MKHTAEYLLKLWNTQTTLRQRKVRFPASNLLYCFYRGENPWWSSQCREETACWESGRCPKIVREFFCDVENCEDQWIKTLWLLQNFCKMEIAWVCLFILVLLGWVSGIFIIVQDTTFSLCYTQGISGEHNLQTSATRSLVFVGDFVFTNKSETSPKKVMFKNQLCNLNSHSG